MFRLALTNAPTRNASVRLSSIANRCPAPPCGRSGISLQWARIERRNNSSQAKHSDSPEAVIIKEDKPKDQLLSAAAERVDAHAKPAPPRDAKPTSSSTVKPSAPLAGGLGEDASFRASDARETSFGNEQDAIPKGALEAEVPATADSIKTPSAVDSITSKRVDQMEELDEDEDLDFENVDTSLEEATVKLFQSQEFAESLESASEPTGPLETPDFGGIVSGASQLPTGRLRTREELGDSYSEVEWHSAIVNGRGVHLPFHHPRTHSIPAAVIHFRSHSPSQLALFTHFAQHAAASLGIPCSGVAALPTKRTLWTVIKGPFVHKKTQENFERRVHKRAIKAWDAHPEVVDLWAGYLRKHALGGVGMRVIKWSRTPVGVGEQMMTDAKKGWKLRKVGNSAEKVKKLGEQIVDMEMRKDLPTIEAGSSKV